MGDRKPKKNSSGNSDGHKAKQAKHAAARPMPSASESKAKDKGKPK